MAVEWSTIRDNIRNNILKDESDRKWTDEDLDVSAQWSLNAFTAHTAKLRTDSFDGDGATQAFQLADEPLQPADLMSQVYVLKNSTKTYLDPVYYTEGSDRSRTNGYFFYPEDTFNLISIPASGTTIFINFFGYWDYPDSSDEDSIFDAPQWAHGPLSYLIASNALSKFASRSADIRQWAENPERGTPEDNSLREQSNYYLNIYEREILRFPRQDRENFFRAF